MLQIIDYTADKKEYIKSLNIEWLEKYASVEPNDIVQLSDPQAEIMDKGGFVFYADFHNEVVGTVSLIRRTDSEFELSKMAVTEKFKGLGIGNKLIEHCIKKAKGAWSREACLIFPYHAGAGYTSLQKI